jgi:membrane-associated phospholipid phosphatase
LLVSGTVTPARAQVTPRTTAHEIGDTFEDSLWASPFHARSKDWAGAATMAGTFALLLPVDPIVDRWVVAHPRAAVLHVLDPFREQGPLMRLATARNLVPIALGLVIAGAVGDNRGLREAGYGCIAGWGLSNTLRYAIYAGVARDRPSISDGNQRRWRIPGEKWDQHSFPAGHAMNAFACASFWTERFDLGAGEPVIYATAAVASLARIADRRHWTSDTFVGAVVGIAAGRSIAASYRRREAKRSVGTALSVARRPVVILWRGAF